MKKRIIPIAVQSLLFLTWRRRNLYIEKINRPNALPPRIKNPRAAASIRRAERYINDFCSGEPLNFGESRLWVKGPRGHAS